MSVISLISILVISLVVWLVVLFLSVTEGIEKKWIEELVALNAPLRMSPTDEYYRSYYYLIDSSSSASGYATKTVGEKLAASGDPYDPDFDSELGSEFPAPDLHPDGTLRDPVKEGFAIAGVLTKKYKGLKPQEYEVNFGNLRLQVDREDPAGGTRQTFLTQVSYIASHDGENSHINKMVLPPSEEDRSHLRHALAITGSSIVSPETLWVCEGPDGKCQIPGGQSSTPLGDGLLVAKHLQKSGVQLGDRGYLAYYALAGSSLQELRLPVYVAGFYDPGMIPIGSKLIFVNPQIAATLRSSTPVADSMLGNGIHIWLDNLSEADNLKKDLIKSLTERGIDKYWTVQSYHDYEFTRPILEQLRSDKNLFTLISIIILVVACSNIISMLILLVNDKKREIGILQSMGASPMRIAAIFGLCGFTTGLVSSVLGIFAAILTLNNLESLVSLLSFLQGREAFQTAFYGSSLPNELSYSVLGTVAIATLVISLLAGIVPAIKASKIHPTEILRVE